MTKQRPFGIALAMALGALLVACGGNDEPVVETTATSAAPETTEAVEQTTTSSTTTETTSAPTTSTLQMGDLEGWETTTITVDDQELTVAVADSARERSQGLRGVEDLGDVDGMLFVFEQPREATFIVEDTLIPLDIGFFDPGGRLVKTYEMVPCPPDEECDTYPSTAAVSHALEVPADTFTFSPDSQLVVP